jgi:hypothetical protein
MTPSILCSIIEGWREGRGLAADCRALRSLAEEVTWYEGYADGQDAPKGVVSANWNEITRWDGNTHVVVSDAMKRLGDLFERMGVQLEWSDGVSMCGGCYKCIQTEPDCMSWSPAFLVGDGDILCESCIASDPEPCLEQAEREDGYWPLNSIDPADHGYVLVDDDHHFRDRCKLAREMKARGVTRYVFTQSRGYSCALYVHESEIEIWNPPAVPFEGPKVAVQVENEDFRDARESYAGWCPHCEEFTLDSGVEPDGDNRECPECGRKDVCGAELAMVRDWIGVGNEVDR